MRPAAVRAKVTKHIGWHSFPAHTGHNAPGKRRVRKGNSGMR